MIEYYDDACDAKIMLKHSGVASFTSVIKEDIAFDEISVLEKKFGYESQKQL
jgi:hypothetical protein